MTAPVYSRTSSAIRRLTPLDPEAFHLAIDGAQRETNFHTGDTLLRAAWMPSAASPGSRGTALWAFVGHVFDDTIRPRAPCPNRLWRLPPRPISSCRGIS
jgi:hypothetical protein